MTKKYVVCGDTRFYPWVLEFDNFKEAKKEYEDSNPFEETVYLCEVIMEKEDPDVVCDEGGSQS